MRKPFITSLFFTFVFTRQVYTTFSGLPEDLEGSGYDLESSGSGEGSEEGGIINITVDPSIKDVRIFAVNAKGGTQNTGSSDLNFDNSLWSPKDSGFVVMANSKSFLERKEILAGVIAGGVAGVIFAAGLAGLLIYKWQKKAEEGYVLGQQRASDEDYYRHNRDEICVF
ncbi:syndecan-4-like [Acanthopagrus schlegelii]